MISSIKCEYVEKTLALVKSQTQNFLVNGLVWKVLLHQKQCRLYRKHKRENHNLIYGQFLIHVTIGTTIGRIYLSTLLW